MKSIYDVDKIMEVKKPDIDGVTYYNILDNKRFSLFGIDQNDLSDFGRFSKDEREYLKSINDSVSWLSLHTAGLQAKFETDSTTINISVKLRGIHDMNHMTAVGQCGFDLYVFDEKLNDYVLHSSSTYNRTLKEYDYPLSCFDTKKKRKYILNFPLYMGVEEVFIGLLDNSYCAPLSFNNDGRVVLYGTSIAQGGCVSRPGLLYSNILSRWFDMEFLNYGFSGSALLEKEIASVIAKRSNAKVLIVDAEANAGCSDLLYKNLEPFIRTYHEIQKDTKILVVSRIMFAMDLYSTHRYSELIKQNKFQRDIVKKLKSEGYDIHFLDGSKFFKGFNGNFTEYTVDGVHPTDLGNYEMAKAHYLPLKKLLK